MVTAECLYCHKKTKNVSNHIHNTKSCFEKQHEHWQREQLIAMEEDLPAIIVFAPDKAKDSATNEKGEEAPQP